MKRFCVLVGVLVIGMSVQAFAAQPGRAERPGRAQREARDQPGRDVTVRASQITGMTVHNPQGDTLGTVHDIVLDARSGRVRYAALSYGGFLGFGETLVAVPWEAFTVQKIEGRDEYNLVLHATEQQIKGATGFDRNNWPDFGDRQLARDLDAHYGIERPRRRGVDVQIGPGGVDVQVEPRPDDR